MKKLIIILVLLFTNLSWAIDQPRMRFSFKSNNQRFELKPCDTLFSDKKVYKDSLFNPRTNSYLRTDYSYPDRYYWGLYDNVKNQKLFTIKNDSLFIEHLSVEISDDGENLIFFDDYSSGMGLKTIPLVTFYKRDQYVKTLKLGNLIDNTCAVSYSVSHMHWCSNWGFVDKNFFIETFEFYRIEISLEGEILSRISCKEIGVHDNLVTAMIYRIGRNKYKLQVKLSIRGELLSGEELIINSRDKEMRRLHGKFYGFLKSRNKKMSAGFFVTTILNNNKIRKIDFRIPTYNSPDNCNYFSQLN